MSAHETALTALAATLETVLEPSRVLRNADLPERVPADGLAILRDGGLGEPEIALGGGGLAYGFDATAELELFVAAGDEETRRQALDGLKDRVSAAIRADRTLGGAVMWAEPRLGALVHEPIDGADGIASAALTVILSFDTDSPTG